MNNLLGGFKNKHINVMSWYARWTHKNIGFGTTTFKKLIVLLMCKPKKTIKGYLKKKKLECDIDL
jgi:hypothetical protein